uniref:Head closure knob n=1 Tax=Siphoviridae sp. ctnMR5 TaxID=2825658 RepID=A0A8S5U8T2_9CAUD|nr:MAG TPA: head closure knob [Siphoviridae sp. ctnMR5]
MSNNSKRYIQTSIAYDGKSILGKPTNAPIEYADRRYQYLSDRTRLFDTQRAYLSSDYFRASVQGLTDNFYEWTDTNIRFADIANVSANATKKNDDFKNILFAESSIDYFPLGAKVKTAGSVWLCINPTNISSVKTNALVCRCNATYNSFDYYGNVIVEPVIVEKQRMLSDANDTFNNLVLVDGYYNITCQLNDNTKDLRQNSRIILGTKAYHITGITDYLQEFTGDRGSCHLLTFTARLEEPQQNDDITTNFIADGLLHSFEAKINGLSELTAGQGTRYEATFIKDGTEIVATTDAPLNWVWSSNDENIISISADSGVAISHNAGTATIRAVLAQNTTVYSELTVSVSETIKTPYVAFDGVIPTEIAQYQTATVTATYYETNLPTQEPLNWNLSGAALDTYNSEISQDRRSVVIECVKSSKKPLIITATYGNYEATVQIDLVGY